ncbi:hypothetical protein M501DRAFT_992945 [Patellaria atrata CBS 101060]|uniref:Uncharacterized protein n=1 Tax=Patellaria atrata CBS 101060 TaxID=1346257 RepID=A0A9P4SAK1_9PEZI|nr:hypothetical protein M501DRAFT_992945 [Patellaria atrata CBS 101060]
MQGGPSGSRYPTPPPFQMAPQAQGHVQSRPHPENSRPIYGQDPGMGPDGTQFRLLSADPDRRRMGTEYSLRSSQIMHPTKFPVTYEGWTFRKVPSNELSIGETPSWSRVHRTQMPVDTEELAKMVKVHRAKTKKSVMEEYSALRSENQRRQIGKLRQELKDSEKNPNAVWNLATIETETRKLNSRATETILMKVIMKRQPDASLVDSSRNAQDGRSGNFSGQYVDLDERGRRSPSDFHQSPRMRSKENFEHQDRPHTSNQIPRAWTNERPTPPVSSPPGQLNRPSRPPPHDPGSTWPQGPPQGVLKSMGSPYQSGSSSIPPQPQGSMPPPPQATSGFMPPPPPQTHGNMPPPPPPTHETMPPPPPPTHGNMRPPPPPSHSNMPPPPPPSHSNMPLPPPPSYGNMPPPPPPSHGNIPPPPPSSGPLPPPPHPSHGPAAPPPHLSHGPVPPPPQQMQGTARPPPQQMQGTARPPSRAPQGNMPLPPQPPQGAFPQPPPPSQGRGQPHPPPGPGIMKSPPAQNHQMAPKGSVKQPSMKPSFENYQNGAPSAKGVRINPPNNAAQQKVSNSFDSDSDSGPSFVQFADEQMNRPKKQVPKVSASQIQKPRDGKWSDQSEGPDVYRSQKLPRKPSLKNILRSMSPQRDQRAYPRTRDKISQWNSYDGSDDDSVGRDSVFSGRGSNPYDTPPSSPSDTSRFSAKDYPRGGLHRAASPGRQNYERAYRQHGKLPSYVLPRAPSPGYIHEDIYRNPAAYRTYSGVRDPIHRSGADYRTIEDLDRAGLRGKQLDYALDRRPLERSITYDSYERDTNYLARSYAQRRLSSALPERDVLSDIRHNTHMQEAKDHMLRDRERALRLEAERNNIDRRALEVEKRALDTELLRQKTIRDAEGFRHLTEQRERRLREQEAIELEQAARLRRPMIRHVSRSDLRDEQLYMRKYR